MANQLPAITHIVQLMLGYRSFDSDSVAFVIRQRQQSPPLTFRVLTSPMSRIPRHRQTDKSTDRRNSPHPYLMREPIRVEGFQNTNYQLFRPTRGGWPARAAVPTNRGLSATSSARFQSDQPRATGYACRYRGRRKSWACMRLRSAAHVLSARGMLPVC